MAQLYMIYLGGVSDLVGIQDTHTRRAMWSWLHTMGYFLLLEFLDLICTT
jgi:hypothetical protein